LEQPHKRLKYHPDDSPSAVASNQLPAPSVIVEDADTREAIKLEGSLTCYVCKRDVRITHSFYDQLCETCGTLNYAKRMQTADLCGRVALVTGGRIKIGFECVLKLLRGGASVIGIFIICECFLANI
jgi:hypothetical protein